MGRKVNWGAVGALLAAVAIVVAYLAAKSTIDAQLTGLFAPLAAPISIPLGVALIVVAATAVGLFLMHKPLMRELKRLRAQAAESAELGEPDADGLYRRDGKPFCPECLRKRAAVYFLQQGMTPRASYGDPFGEMVHISASPSKDWQCSVCHTTYTQL